MKKQILMKVFTPSGEFIDAWTDAKFVSFQKEINSGLGECVIEIGRQFDAIGRDIALNNKVEIFVSDKQTVLETEGIRKIYSGYISNIQPNLSGSQERLFITLLGYYTKLSLDILKNGTQTTLYTEASAGLSTSSPSAAADIGLVVRAMMARYVAETVNPEVSYNSASVPDVGDDINFTFEQKTYREAIEKVKMSAPSGYYYFFDENNVLNFKAKSATADHKFIFGKHFSSLRIERSMEKIRNFMLIWNGDTVYEHYEDAGSIAVYGRRAERLIDYGIKDSATADLIGTKFVAENKDPDVRIICEIMDNNNEDNRGYDIESIQPGDTCSFLNFSSSLNDFLKENMLITKVVYYLDKIELTVENVRTGLVDIQEKTKKNVDDLSTAGSPETYS